jgi:hypothetical protein
VGWVGCVQGGGVMRAGVAWASAETVCGVAVWGFGAGAERPSTLSPMHLSSIWIGLIVSMMRLNSWVTSEGGAYGVDGGAGEGVRGRAPESGSLNVETATTSSESSTMALAAQWMDELKLLSLESKSIGRGGSVADDSSLRQAKD